MNVLGSPTQIRNAITYLFTNAEHHYTQIEGAKCTIDWRAARAYFYVRDEKTADLFPGLSRAPKPGATPKRCWVDAYTSASYLFADRHFAREGETFISRPRNVLVARESLECLRKL